MSRPNEDEIIGAIVLAILLIVFTVMVKIVNHSGYIKDNDPSMQPTSSANSVLQPSNQTHNNSALIPKFNQELSSDMTHQETAEEKSEISASSDIRELLLK
ncbi:MAG: hypothetical protein AB2606_07365 [Candidatus Thiodiazotropha taylori]